VICTSITIFRVFGAESKKEGRDTMSDKGESPNWLLCRKMRGAGWTEVHAAVFEF